MSDVSIGTASSFADPGRKVVDIGGVEIGIFQLDGRFYAYENNCPHQQGPACQGKILPLTTEAVMEDKTSIGRVFSKDHTNVVCPWHGFEFDIRTGEHVTIKRVKLRAVPVRVEGGEVYVTLPRDRTA
jgi:nitrite reductase (NADH) small subunit